MESARPARLLLLFIVVLILYGSLYPGVLHPGGAPAAAMDYLLHSWPRSFDPRIAVDALLNVLIYVPLGWLGYLSLAGAPRAVRLAGAVGFGCALSLTVELAQFYIEGRVTSLLDVASNSCGTAAGVFGAQFLDALLVSRLARWREPLDRERAAVVLILCWLSYHLFPFVPSIGLYRLAVRLRAMLAVTAASLPVGTLAGMAEWLAVGALLRGIAGTSSPQVLVALLAVLPARLLIVHQQLTLAEVLGALLGVALNLALWRKRREAPAAAVLMLASLCVSGLAPFHFTDTATPFSWRPFHASFNTANWEPAGIVLLRKVFRYGAFLWLSSRCGMRPWRGAAFLSLSLLTIEIAQTHIAPHTPEITDPALALLLALALRLLAVR
ncbi:MAG: VanZ family protein [Bryobacterales bacterium]|nr:VanZ family protein [Bryobacterales bacterium]